MWGSLVYSTTLGLQASLNLATKMHFTDIADDLFPITFTAIFSSSLSVPVYGRSLIEDIAGKILQNCTLNNLSYALRLHELQ